MARKLPSPLGVTPLIESTPRNNKQLRSLRTFQILLETLHQNEGEVPYEVLIEDFATRLPYEDPAQLLDTVIDWGRFAELIGYRPKEDVVYLDVGEPTGE